MRVTIAVTVVIGLLGILSLTIGFESSLLKLMSFSQTSTPSTPAATSKTEEEAESCGCSYPPIFESQAGQDEFVLKKFFFVHNRCCMGTFVEFGARDGIEHSNTYAFEKYMGWKGLLFEVEPDQYIRLLLNRPNLQIVQGPICPSYQKDVTILLSSIPGWTGAQKSYEPQRKDQGRPNATNFECHHLAKELRERNMYHVDYMTIDTEGSEADFIKDFPWSDFDIHVVQIEQLNEHSYPAQKGKRDAIVEHMNSVGYSLHMVYPVAPMDTDDLIFAKNVSTF